MERVLVATGKYDDIQLVTAQTTASQVKDSLRQFFGKYQSPCVVEEAFVYFSGHGFYQNDAFLCCSDYDSNRPATTSISNAELDDLLRSVNPEVAIKVIDACHSGSLYIKDASASFESALKKSTLNSFICMASSKQDQPSFASLTESFFTAKWIESALAKDAGHVLYRDIQAALADAFISNPEQTPFFVNQGTGLEVFSQVTERMKELNAHLSNSIPAEKPVADITKLLDQEIMQRDKQFVPQAQVFKATEESKIKLSSENVTDPIVKKFYKKSVKADGKLVSIPEARSVATFAEDQSWSKRYFVKVNFEEYKARSLKDVSAFIGAMGISRLLAPRSDSDYVVQTKLRPGSLEVTETLPLELAELSFTSTHPSLAAFQIYIGVVHSLTEVMVLSSTVRLKQKGWASKAPELSEVQWRYKIYPWTDVVKEPVLLWRDAQAQGEADIRNYLESLMPKTEVSEVGGPTDSSETARGAPPN